MISIIVSLIIMVLAVAVPITGVLVKKWGEVFIILSVLIVVLGIINLILTLFNVY